MVLPRLWRTSRSSAQVAAGAEDYYLGRDKSPGQWRGSGGSALDLTLGTRVERKQFMALTRGERAGCAASARRGHRAATRDPPPVRRGELPPPLARGHRVDGRQLADFTARGGVSGSPLTDRRSAARRAIAIRAAILAALDRGDSPARIEAAIWSASAAGVPGGQARLFDWPAAVAEETT